MTLFGDRKFEIDENGRTCLHYAVWGGSLKVMRYLVDVCRFDLGLRTAVSCAYLVYHMYRQDRYNDKTQCICMYTHNPAITPSENGVNAVTCVSVFVCRCVLPCAVL